VALERLHEMAAEGGFGAVGVPGNLGVNDLQVLSQGGQGEWGRQAAIESDETQVIANPVTDRQLSLPSDFACSPSRRPTCR
jgi:hypothetical protein